MKKLIIVIVTTVMVHGFAFTQGCLPEGITVRYQSDVDNFQTNYPGCTVIEGSVYFDGLGSGAIDNLDGLSVLTEIKGALHINQCDYLTDLSGFENLTSVNGLTISRCDKVSSLSGLENLQETEAITLRDNPLLSDITALSHLTRLEYLTLSSNNSLTHLQGLHNINYVGNDFYMLENLSLTNLQGLGSLDSVGGDFIIQRNNGFQDLSGMENLRVVGGRLSITGSHYMKDFLGQSLLGSIGGEFDITENVWLENLSGLENLTHTGGLSLAYNHDLNNLDGLTNLLQVTGSLTILDNDGLWDIQGIKQINPDSIESLRISGNDILSACAVESVCNFIFSSQGESLIGYNNEGCNNPEEVLDACNSFFCFPEGISFENQAALESFKEAYPDCIGVQGDVRISGSDITDLSYLNQISSIGGNLIISENPLLEDLTGISNLNLLGGSLTITNNSSLANCDVQSVCDYLVSPNAAVDIHSNKSGCNSQAEVVEVCFYGVPALSLESLVKIFPNPADRMFSVSLTNGWAVHELIVYNSMGQPVIQETIAYDKIDVSGLQPGLYVLELLTEYASIRKKLLIR